jgi:GH15 family glucan-1,4-alpha-glucosidase
VGAAKALIEHVERHWTEPDEGIWEARSGRRHFTHSKVMALVAIDRAVQAVGAFLACSFWLVDNLALAGHREEAERLFGQLVDLRNDVGLLSEEYDPSRQRLTGNFPQAFSHVGLVNSAFELGATAPSERAR